MLLTKMINSILLLFLLLISIQSYAFDLPDFTVLVEQHSKAVVNISTTHGNNSGKKPSPSLGGGGVKVKFSMTLCVVFLMVRGKECLVKKIRVH